MTVPPGPQAARSVHRGRAARRAVVAAVAAVVAIAVPVVAVAMSGRQQDVVTPGTSGPTTVSPTTAPPPSSTPPSSTPPASTGLALVYLDHRAPTAVVLITVGGGQERHPVTIADLAVNASESGTVAPDGQRVAWINGRTGKLDMAALDGSGQVEVDASVVWGCGMPVWSPDARQVAFVTGTSDAPTVEVVNADGSGRHVVDEDGGCWPTWSVDGSLLAYVKVQHPTTGGSQVITARPDGTGRRIVPVQAPQNTRVRMVLSISTDGRAVVELQGVDPGGCGCDEGTRLWFLNAPQLLDLANGSVTPMTDPNGDVEAGYFRRGGGLVLRVGTRTDAEAPVTIVVYGSGGEREASWTDPLPSWVNLMGIRESA